MPMETNLVLVWAPTALVSHSSQAHRQFAMLTRPAMRCSDAKRFQYDLRVCRQVAVIINDRVDVAIASGADGAHIGQTDLPVAAARRLLGPTRILGVSCKTVAQALAAEADGADYLGCGAREHPCGPHLIDDVTLSLMTACIQLCYLWQRRP